jgi:hypothetical protein
LSNLQHAQALAVSSRRRILAGIANGGANHGRASAREGAVLRVPHGHRSASKRATVSLRKVRHGFERARCPPTILPGGGCRAPRRRRRCAISGASVARCATLAAVACHPGGSFAAAVGLRRVHICERRRSIGLLRDLREPRAAARSARAAARRRRVGLPNLRAGQPPHPALLPRVRRPAGERATAPKASRRREPDRGGGGGGGGGLLAVPPLHARQ